MDAANLATRVDPDGHYFTYADGSPFFYLADTAWVLLAKLTDEEIEGYFADRASKGFNAIQACVFRDLFEPNTPDVYGTRPFASDDDMHAVRMNPDWSDRVVRITNLAAKHGLVMALLPTWGDKWNSHSNSAGPVIMDADSGRAYCRFLSDALAGCPNVIWVLGGDSPVRERAHVRVVRAMAEGLRSGGGGERMITFYPTGLGSSEIFHSEDWLDFNALQTSHFKPNVPGYLYVERFFRTTPAKPAVDMEPNYEGARMFVFGAEQGARLEHKSADQPYLPQFSAYDVRKSYYRTVLAGAAGFTYGNDSVRQIYRDGDRPHAWEDPNLPYWQEAMASPGSFQLRVLADVLHARRYATRIPAQELFLPFRQAGAWPDALGIGLDFVGQQNIDPAVRISVARCTEGSYILAYLPVRNLLTLDTSGLRAGQLVVTILDPESGEVQRRFERANTGTIRLVPDRDLDSFVVVDVEKPSK